MQRPFKSGPDAFSLERLPTVAEAPDKCRQLSQCRRVYRIDLDRAAREIGRANEVHQPLSEIVNVDEPQVGPLDR